MCEPRASWESEWFTCSQLYELPFLPNTVVWTGGVTVVSPLEGTFVIACLSASSSEGYALLLSVELGR